MRKRKRETAESIPAAEVETAEWEAGEPAPVASAAEEATDWALPERGRPPLLSELVERIDEAVATARASEAAVMTVGAAALDAAEQARRAANLAARASARLERQVNNAGASTDPVLGDFDARADRLAERLRRLQRVPLSA